MHPCLLFPARPYPLTLCLGSHWGAFLSIAQTSGLAVRTRKASQEPQMWVQVLPLPASRGALDEFWIPSCLHCGRVRMTKAGVGPIWPPEGAWCPLSPICPPSPARVGALCLRMSIGSGLHPCSTVPATGCAPWISFLMGMEGRGAFNDRTLLRSLLMIPC